MSTSSTTCTFQMLALQTVMLRFKKKSDTSTSALYSGKNLNFFTEGLFLGFKPEGKVKVTVYNNQGIEIAQISTSSNTKVALPSAGIYMVKSESNEFGQEVQKMFVNN